MTVGPFVIDTNVIVAALLTTDATAPTARVLDGMIGGHFLYLLSPALLEEYRTVLLRPAIRGRHGLSVEEVDQILEELVSGAVWREPVGRIPAPDPGDDHLWALAGCHPGTCLVTGDQLLLGNPPDNIRVITPRQFSEERP